MPQENDDKVGHHVSKEAKSPDEVDGANVDPRLLGEVGLGGSHHCCHQTVAKLKNQNQNCMILVTLGCNLGEPRDWEVDGDPLAGLWGQPKHHLEKLSLKSRTFERF